MFVVVIIGGGGIYKCLNFYMKHGTLKTIKKKKKIFFNDFFHISNTNSYNVKFF